MGTTKKKDLMTDTGDQGSIRISIIMPLPLLNKLRMLADENDVGYQTLIKDVLTKYVETNKVPKGEVIPNRRGARTAERDLKEMKKKMNEMLDEYLRATEDKSKSA